MPEAADAPPLRAAVFVREIGKVSKSDHISRIFTATPVPALWLGKLAQGSPVPWPGTDRGELASQ